MINIYTNKETKLRFKLNVEGSNLAPQVRLVVKFIDDNNLLIEGLVYQDRVTVTVPKLDKYLNENKSKILKAFLEVIVDDNYFVTWKDDFQIIDPVNVTVEKVIDDTKKESIEENHISTVLEEIETDEIIHDVPQHMFD